MNCTIKPALDKFTLKYHLELKMYSGKKKKKGNLYFFSVNILQSLNVEDWLHYDHNLDIA